MATAGTNSVDYKLVHVGTLELEDPRTDTNQIKYIGITVLPDDMLMVVDGVDGTVRLHSSNNGQLLAAPERLQSGPSDICTIDENGSQVAVTGLGQIYILSVESTGQSKAIRQVRTLDVSSGFDGCHGVKTLRYKSKLVVSGRKKDENTKKILLCWGLVNFENGPKDDCVETVHTICTYPEYCWSYLALSADYSTVYISCSPGNDSPNNYSVYAFDIRGRQKFRYRHSDLVCSTGISVDNTGFIYVCNWADPPCIHQLTVEGQQVTVHWEELPPKPKAMSWKRRQRQLYVTRMFSKEVWILHPSTSNQKDIHIPAEVLNMDAGSLEMYKEALQDGKEKVYNIRLMIVGQYGVGKTTLTKRLLGKDVKISERNPTEGIDVHIECCKVSLANGEWTVQEQNAEQNSRLQRLVQILDKHVQSLESSGEQEGTSQMDDDNQIYRHDNGHQAGNKLTLPPIQHKKSDTSKKYTGPVSEKKDTMPVSENKNDPTKVSENENDPMPVSRSRRKDVMMEIIKLVNKNVHKLQKSIEKYASLAMWDFAGQYAFYTTHQTFLTSRAIYLLVVDLSQEFTDLIKGDQYFLDTEGIKQCKVHDLVEMWMNSIHSCAPSHETDFPHVIVVGTHVDKIPQRSRQKVIGEYYKKICHMLKDKPTIVHLKGDFALDNTKCDPKLKDLKRRIMELALQQPHWGEEKPSRWLTLEHAIMKLKATGTKIVPFSLVEKMSKSGSVTIENTDELDLFLKFQHEVGTILYFGIEKLREKIVLDPQWLIDALKSLITAEMFIITSPAKFSKWCEFRDTGKLTHELIDVIWTRETNRVFHKNKEHILLLMEELHIIARPRVFNEIGEEVEDYFLAPCVLRQESPREVINPEQDPWMVSTSVLCFSFTGKFLPPPIFHRLLAACVARWPVAKKKETSENLIFCGCCVFDLDLLHRLTLHFTNHVICARITGMVIAEVKTPIPNAQLCTRVRKFIDLNLSKIVSCMGQNLQYEICVQSQPSKNAPLTVPVQMWFADEKDPNPAISPEHMNYARLCIALATVCADALRKILLTHVPRPHTDIYQAILANHINLTCKKLGKPALLNKDQSQVVFTDPQCRYTAPVDHFDISLLYTLIRNVSTVVAPVATGWGNDPCDQPRDTSLGASVERIRSYRNHIIGHSATGTISKDVFDDYRMKIKSVLHDIETEIGGHVYSQELEKQHQQVISIYEAC